MKYQFPPAGALKYLVKDSKGLFIPNESGPESKKDQRTSKKKKKLNGKYQTLFAVASSLFGVNEPFNVF